jgi:hypothetical protein
MRENQIKASDAGKILIFAGIAITLLGFGLSLIVEKQDYIFGYYYPVTIHPYMLIGIIMVSMGINWFFGGLILKSTGRDVANDGILLGLVFGALGVLMWLTFSARNKDPTITTYSEEAHRHCPNCGMAIPFYTIQYYPHCKQKLDQTNPSYTIREIE